MPPPLLDLSFHLNGTCAYLHHSCINSDTDRHTHTHTGTDIQTHSHTTTSTTNEHTLRGCRANTYGSELYLLQYGTVKVVLPCGDVVSTLGDGSFFGGMQAQESNFKQE